MPAVERQSRVPTGIDHAIQIESVDARMIGLMRCVLAFSALIIISLDPVGPERFVTLTYTSLVFYCAYSTALLFIAHRTGLLAPFRAAHWIDVCFYLYLVALTEATSSIFFYFFFFPILVASFSRGYREGLLVTATSTALFIIVGLVFAPYAYEYDLNRTLTRPIYLFAIGYMITYWGGYEIMLKRRLKLLKEVNNLWNLRFGVDHTIGTNLDRLLDLYEGRECTFVLARPTNPASYLMYSASRQKRGQALAPSEIAESTARLLLNLPDTFAAAYYDPARFWWRKYWSYIAYNLDARTRTETLLNECKVLANLLDAQSFVTVPYTQHNGTSGRIYITSINKAFTQSDIEFLSQFAGTISPVIENMQLMDELILKAAEHERYKISRDIHDTTVQPYIGLKLGLEALYREAGSQNPLSRQIRELLEMASMTIRDLRHYAATFREKTSMSGDFLISAVNEQVERLKLFYGLDVDVKSDITARLSGRLAAESFQIISEGLSNVLRHTNAKRAFVAVFCETDKLLLKIGNEKSTSGIKFTPHSIHERAHALGGTTFVEQSADGYTIVHVTIPM